ncbi:CRISPR-associated ring nuclease Csm6 [Uruburuella testudinis]|uniref:CRISPR-associated ring nuclease Csm6 n=1 Tax=Uruburuella testudinis TaxID=1282863 RepID=A0ABY4DQA0_9NEIS|nr:CRISPR-associated ring nuclease Csm6 [Uruburuella testudinis]UOO81229.1 CRISPR-associated ring nuclease Csm6 [Uruburuella testudinis]
MVDKRKILVAVTGMSPQIVTETLYALHTQHQWLPEEIHVLTTQTGAENIVGSLLGDNGFFGRLCAEYALPSIRFDAGCIHVIKDNRGEPLADIRSPEENNLAADQIVRFIHDLCADEQTELHVSIAGGRKSMGFYIGYALSLFGRRQDRLSHVLVEEAFEQNREFFYPPQQSKMLSTPRGMRDAAEAQVMLADIPFVRMREGMPKLVLADGWSFSQAVAVTQKDLADFHLVIDCRSLRILCGDAEPIKLTEREFSFYLAMAEFRIMGKALVRQKSMNDDAELLKRRYWHYYRQLKESLRVRQLGDMQCLEKRFGDLDIQEIWKEVPTRIKNKLTKYLCDYAKYYEIESSGCKNRKQYCLAVEPEKIEIHYGEIKRFEG